jgi:hypothetical protein
MSSHRSSAATRPFPLSPDLYGFYRPSTGRSWSRLAVLGIGGLCAFTLLGGLMLANLPAHSVVAEAASADALGGKQKRAETPAVTRPQDAMARFPADSAMTKRELAETAQAPTILHAKPPAAKHAQPARRYAVKKPYHPQAQGYWRNDRSSWGRRGYAGNPGGGGWSFN